MFCSSKDMDNFYCPDFHATIVLHEHPITAGFRANAKGWKTLKKTKNKMTKSSKKNQKSSNKVAIFLKKVAKITL